jgi:dolichol-phosphate mannosyltransferase
MMNKMAKTVVIIVPTYNECENIEPLIEKLHVQFETMPHRMHILVVDDESPDGTAAIVRRCQTCYPRLHLLEGKKDGLGAAYIRGMRYALKDLQADVVFEMDADFSHRPEDIPRLMAEIDDGADFVIGSRYVEGGSISGSWSLLRRLISYFGNTAARYIAGLYQTRDCTAGFRAIRTSLLSCIDINQLRVQGYAFQVALLHAAAMAGARIKEIPVSFIDRKYGDSKLGLSDIIEFIVNVWWLRLKSSKIFIKFALVGALGVFVNLGCFTLFLSIGMNKFIASPLAIELSILSNFFFNNFWTFRQRKSKESIQIKGLKFNLVSIFTLGVSYLTFIGSSFVFPKTAPQLHQLVAIIPGTLINYLLNSYWTFRHEKYTDVEAEKIKNFGH